MKNKYVIRSRISETKFKEILKYFSLDLQANQIAEISGLSRNSINTYIKAIRMAITDEKPLEKDDLEDQHVLFGLKNIDDKIIIEIIPTELNTQVLKLVKGKNRSNFDIEFTGVIDAAHKKYYQIHLSQSNTPPLNITNTASFWGYSKIRLAKFRGISEKNIFLHLKECEYRYNHRQENLYKLMLTQFRKNPLHL